MSSVRLTMAQALVRYLAAQRTEVDGVELPSARACGRSSATANVAGLGDALLTGRRSGRRAPQRNRTVREKSAG